MEYQWNYDALDRLDSEGSAWLAGWLFGKGGLSSYNGSSYLSLYIPYQNRQLLPTLKDLLGFKGVITRDRREERNVDYFRIRLPATGLEDGLQRLGVGAGGRAPIERMPERLRSHFFRGYGEARGCWGRSGAGWYFYISCKEAGKLMDFRDWTESIGCSGARSIYPGDISKLYIKRRGDLQLLYQNFYTCEKKFTVPRERTRAEQAMISMVKQAR